MQPTSLPDLPLKQSRDVNHVLASRVSHRGVVGRLLAICVVVSGLSFTAIGAKAAQLQSSVLNRHQQQRDTYIELRQLVAEEKFSVVSSRRTEIEGYPLAYYLDYLLLRKQIEVGSAPATLLKLVDAHHNNHQDDRLRSRLLSVLKNRAVALAQWEEYSLIAQQDNNPSHPCDDLLSLVKNGRLKKFNTLARELWATPSKHTSSCDEAFPVLIATAKDVPTRSLWQRMVALIISHQLDEAGELLRYFNPRDRKTVEAWINGIDAPVELLQSAAMRGSSEHHQRLAKFLQRKWVREDLPAASRFWRQHGTRFGFSEKDVVAQVSNYAVLAAKLSLPEAADLLSAAETSRDVRYWRVRMALRAQNWHAVLEQLDGLNGKEKKSHRWQYWRARALDELGFRSAAAKIHQGLSAKFEYYGFLAADQVSAAYNIEVAEVTIDSGAAAFLRNSTRIQRAIEFFLVDTAWEGRREWNLALDGASAERLVAAAQLANSLGWYDRGFAAMKLARRNDALETLFPTPHESLVDGVAGKLSVPKELVYGVMRQESSFIPDIKSPVGAIGLMQLMPATAQEMGRKLGLKVPAWKLTDSELNIRLGVKYLEHVLHRFDRNIVLAAAAYNAGPHRVNQWVSDQRLPADIWVETIPFDETRDYVKSVLFNTTVSDWRLQGGGLTRLRVRMPDVLPMG